MRCLCLKRITVKQKEKYPSASIMLDISRNEYERERERASILDNKASFFISALIAVVTIFIPIVPFAELRTFFKTSTTGGIVLVTISLCLFLIAIVFLILAICNLFKGFYLTKYKNVNVENLNDEETLQFAENQTERGLLKHYNTILSYNIDINNERAEKIAVGFKYYIFSFAFLCVSTISLIIIIGG